MLHFSYLKQTEREKAESDAHLLTFLTPCTHLYFSSYVSSSLHLFFLILSHLSFYLSQFFLTHLTPSSSRFDLSSFTHTHTHSHSSFLPHLMTEVNGKEKLRGLQSNTHLLTFSHPMHTRMYVHVCASPSHLLTYSPLFLFLPCYTSSSL